MNHRTLTAGTAALLFLMTGCHKKVGGQVVAVVNGEEVSQQELNAELQAGGAPPAGDAKQMTKGLLQQIVDRKLLVQKAKAERLDTSPEYLEQTRRADETILVSLLVRRYAKAIAVPDAATVDRYIADHPATFGQRKRYVLDQVAFVQPPDRAVMEKLRPVHTLDEITTILSGAGIDFKRGQGTLDTATIAPAVGEKIAALPAGEPFVVPVNGRIFVSVIKATEAIPFTGASARPAAAELIRQQSLRDAITKQLQAARAGAQVSYQPGFAPSGKAPSVK